LLETILRLFNTTVVSLFLGSLLACNFQYINDKATEISALSEIEQTLKVKFPSDARIVFSEEKTRQDKKSWYQREIIYSSEPIQFSRQSPGQMPAEIVIASMNVAGIKPQGKLVDKNALFFETQHKDTSWKVYQTQFETGSYIDVWRFKGADVWEFN
jgi:hypothetical protein